MTGHTGNAVETDGLSKQYGAKWALRSCTLDVPEGSVCALVGPNGAGKSTLLQLLAGLLKPTAGRATVLGAAPCQSPAWLSEIGFLAQDIPLYKRLTAEQLLGMGRHLNERWDDRLARGRLEALGLAMDRPVGRLSGGERAQVALALALGKRPRLLLLDEPVASLDPLARREFLSSLAQATAETELTVVLSSHLVADIERVSDHLVILSRSHVQLSGNVEELLACHSLLVGPRRPESALSGQYELVSAEHTERQTTLLVKHDGRPPEPWWEVSPVGLEDLVLAYMARGAAGEGSLRAPVSPLRHQTGAGPTDLQVLGRKS
jgi:ABC-2 type transport system ATP-binding protein